MQFWVRFLAFENKMISNILHKHNLHLNLWQIFVVKTQRLKRKRGLGSFFFHIVSFDDLNCEELR